MLFGPRRQFYFENEELVKLYQSKREGVCFYKKKRFIRKQKQSGGGKKNKNVVWSSHFENEELVKLYQSKREGKGVFLQKGSRSRVAG